MIATELKDIQTQELLRRKDELKEKITAEFANYTADEASEYYMICRELAKRKSEGEQI